MSIDQIKRIAAERASTKAGITVIVLDPSHPIIRGVCAFAGKNKFRVNTNDAALFIPYDEVEAVE